MASGKSQNHGRNNSSDIHNTMNKHDEFIKEQKRQIVENAI